MICYCLLCTRYAFVFYVFDTQLSFTYVLCHCLLRTWYVIVFYDKIRYCLLRVCGSRFLFTHLLYTLLSFTFIPWIGIGFSFPCLWYLSFCFCICCKLLSVTYIGPLVLYIFIEHDCHWCVCSTLLFVTYIDHLSFTYLWYFVL